MKDHNFTQRHEVIICSKVWLFTLSKVWLLMDFRKSYDPSCLFEVWLLIHKHGRS